MNAKLTILFGGLCTMSAGCHSTEKVALNNVSDFRCEIQIIDGVRLQRDSTGDWDPGSSAVATGNGIIVAAAEYDSHLLSWNPDGTRLMAVGRQGHGPGEFSSAALQVFIDATDSVHVYDGVRWAVLDQKLSNISSRNTKPVGTQGYTHFLDDGLILTTRPIAGYRAYFSVSRQDGSIVRTFGHIDRSLRQFGPTLARRSTPPHAGRFWVAPSPMAGQGYVLERWDITGRMELRVERNVPWLQAFDVEHRPLSPPPSQFGLLHEDETGLLWTITIEPNSDWHDIAGEVSPEDIFEMATYRIEVIDPAASEVVASERIEHIEDIPTLFFGSSRRALFRWDDPLGSPQAEVKEYALVSKNGGSCVLRERQNS